MTAQTPTAYVIMCWDAGQNIDTKPEERPFEAAWWPVAVVATEEIAERHCGAIRRCTRARVEYREVWSSPEIPSWAAKGGPDDRLWWSWIDHSKGLYPVPMDGEWLPYDDEFDPYDLMRERAPGDHDDDGKTYAIASNVKTAGRRMMAIGGDE